MSESSETIVLPRPAPPPSGAGPLDGRLYDLVEGRFRRIIRDHPLTATVLGIHTEDERLGDPSREAVLGELAADREHLAAVEALDAEDLSEDARFERDLEVHNVRQAIFETEVVRTWERRSTALATAGDAIFLLFVRGSAPLAKRLVSISARLEAIPAYLEGGKSRATVPQVRRWQQYEIDAARDLPRLFDELRVAGDSVLADAERRRLARAIETAMTALGDHVEWLTGSLANGSDDWAIGRERYDELIAHRAFDGLTSDEILEIGREQLREEHRLRREAALEIDPEADEPTVIERLRDDHPASFEEALEAYRDVMHRARNYLIERDLVTVPEDERISVIPTPAYLRRVMPFAAYFEVAPFDPDHTGIYIVTPAVDDDPNALREHHRGSISNTSIHEAYPGHHLQLTVARRHPSLSRLLTEAPEFVEGWGMYSEQLMREHGFDDGPWERLTMHTDAIWRACRIILDVRMHRGEVTPEEAVDFLIEHTAFEVANARAEVKRYTYTPTYQLSYLLGKVMLLQLREDEQRRRGAGFQLRDFHDSLLRAGSLPISFHRRLLQRGETPGGGAGAPTQRAAH